MVAEAGPRISRDHIFGRRLFHHYGTLLKLYSHLGLHSDTLCSYFLYKCFIYTSFVSVRVKCLRKGSPTHAFDNFFPKSAVITAQFSNTLDARYLHQQEGGVRCCDLKAPSMAKEAVTKVEEQGLTHRAQNTPSHALSCMSSQGDGGIMAGVTLAGSLSCTVKDFSDQQTGDMHLQENERGFQPPKSLTTVYGPAC